jgi:uncharacterized membrane protein YhaH (DUF805 family)
VTSTSRAGSDLLRFLFGFDQRVGPREYAIAGLVLGVLKLGVDLLVIRLFLPAAPLPVFFMPLHSLGQLLARLPSTWGVMLALWALPFLWIGVSLTIRRAADAGWSPWWGLLFFVPWVNLAVFAVLSLVPSAPGADWRKEPAREASETFRAALQATGIVTLVGLVLIAAFVKFAGAYTLGLFCGMPFALGALGAFLFNRREERPMRETMGVVFVTQILVMGGVILFALEGMLCVAMAIPLAFPIGCLGGVVGREIALRRPREIRMACLMVAALPLAGSLPSALRPLDVTTTSIEVDAPPEVVWRHVVSFSELPPPREVLFQIGVAYPVRARIAGTGVGAVRHCEFSTGAFVEPITVWDAPSRLAFDVAKSPLPMEEWSPYRDVYARHLDSGFQSRRGEFRLVPLPGGRTRLEGRTWYELSIEPHPYWWIQADAIVHTIHRRVLRHVKHLAEEDAHQVAAIRPPVPLDRSARRP